MSVTYNVWKTQICLLCGRDFANVKFRTRNIKAAA